MNKILSWILIMLLIFVVIKIAIPQIIEYQFLRPRFRELKLSKADEFGFIHNFERLWGIDINFDNDLFAARKVLKAVQETDIQLNQVSSFNSDIHSYATFYELKIKEGFDYEQLRDVPNSDLVEQPSANCQKEHRHIHLKKDPLPSWWDHEVANLKDTIALECRGEWAQATIIFSPKKKRIYYIDEGSSDF